MSEASAHDSLARALATLEQLEASFDADTAPSVQAAAEAVAHARSALDELVQRRSRARSAYRVADRMRAMGVSTAGLAHELRSPLSAMSMQAQVSLMRKDLDETSRKDFEGMLAGIKRMTAMVTTAVEFAEPTAMRRPLVIGEVVERIEPFFKVRLRQSEVELKVELDAGLPEVRGIEVELAQVLINLLDNAVRSAEAKGGAVRVSLRACSDDGGLRLEVEDGGLGVSETLEPQLFSDHISESDGFGLGLGVARDIVVEHGGRLELESARAPTRFAVWLPAA